MQIQFPAFAAALEMCKSGLDSAIQAMLIFLCLSELRHYPILSVLAQVGGKSAKIIGITPQTSSSIGNGNADVDSGEPYVHPAELVQMNRFVLDPAWDAWARPALREYNFNLTYVTSDMDGLIAPSLPSMDSFRPYYSIQLRRYNSRLCCRQSD